MKNSDLFETTMEKNTIIKMVSVLDCRCSYFVHILSIKK